MSQYKPTDTNGVEIETGDLIVSYGRVGIVSKINNYNAPSVKIPTVENIYAHEWGAPDVEEEYNDWKYSEYYDLPYEERRTYKGELKTRMVKDKRVVGTRPGSYTQNRQNTRWTLVLRKADGSRPSALGEVFEKHEQLFPAKETGGSDE